MSKIVHVGCGYWGKNLLRNFFEIGALYKVSDINNEEARKYSEMYNVPQVSFQNALDDNAVDAISIATPAKTHYQLVKMALNAGKNVYVEKPLATNLQQARELHDLANKKSLILMVGHILQYHPKFKKMKECTKQGLIGSINYVYSNRLSFGKIRSEESVLWSFGPHDASMILSLVSDDCIKVSAQSGNYIRRDIPDLCSIQLEFARGIKGHINLSWLNPYKEHRLVVIGSKGMLVFEDSESDWDKKLQHYIYNVDKNNSANNNIDELKYIHCEIGEPMKEELSHFINCISNKKMPITNSAESIKVLEIISQADSCIES